MSRPSRRRAARPVLARDTEVTAFTALLSDLIARIPGARAAALVDRDGESVDYAGALSPFDVKIAAAHWQIILVELDGVTALRHARQVVVRAEKKSFVVRALGDGYAVVVVLGLRAGFLASTRAFHVFQRGLRAEAGIGEEPPGPAWSPVLVEEDGRARPRAVSSCAGGILHPVDVLGAVMGLGAGERGFRLRFGAGFETTIVREPGGAWYTEEPIEQADRTPA